MEKLKWKLKYDKGLLSKNFENVGDSNGTDVLDVALKIYGVDNVTDFANPKESSLISPFLMQNMDAAVGLLHDIIGKESSRILIIVDPDVDGFTSASVMYQFIKTIHPETKVATELNFEKQHGLSYTIIPKLNDVNLIIVPDASFEEKDIQKIREKSDVPILVLDHHEVDLEVLKKYATVVNCTDGSYFNPSLTGVGVVYKFCQAYCRFYELDETIPDQWLDLVSLGLIADSADARQLETRWYMLKGMETDCRNNELLNELEKIKVADGAMHLGRTIMNMGWYIAPLINGCIRYGKEDEQKLVFKAMCGEQGEIWYQPRRKRASDPLPEKVLHTVAEEAARVCKTVKNRQDAEIRRYLTDLIGEIDEKNLNKNRVLFLDGSEILKKKTVTGLVANKIATKYMKPCVLLKEFSPTEYGGSGRAYQLGEMEDFSSFLMGTGMFESCSGHPNAFGVRILKQNLEEAIEICNKTLPEEALSTVFKVDFQIAGDDLTPSAVESIANKYYLFGNNVPPPSFAITNIKIPAKKIQNLPDRTIHFIYKKVHYMIKYPRSGVFESLSLADRNILGSNPKQLQINLIGSFSLEMLDNELTPVVKFQEGQFDVEEIEGTEYDNRTANTVVRAGNNVDFSDILNFDFNGNRNQVKADVPDYMDEAKMKKDAIKKRLIDIDDDFVF